MAYWVASSLARLMPQAVQGIEVIGANTQPVNLTDFDVYISQRGAEFDSAAAKAGYAVPIASTASSYPFVQMIVGLGARADALDEIYSGKSDKADTYRSAYELALARISAGELPLLAPPDTSGGGRQLPRGGGIVTPVITASMGAPQSLSLQDW